MRLGLKMYQVITKLIGGKGIGKLPIIMQLNMQVISKLRSDTAIIDGHKMLLDKGDSLSLSINPAGEAKERELFKRIISKGDTVLDVGAHVGVHTLLFARLVGDKGKVIAFEPNTKNFNLLKKNIEINGYDNVQLENKAASDINGKSSFFCNEDFTAGSSIFKRKEENQTKIEVDTVILDDYFKNSNTRVDFIKIDVECSELKVLNGLRKTLKNNDNLKILIEYSYPCREAFNIEPNDNMKFLSEYGFHFSDATYEDATVFFDYDYLVSKYTNYWINFFCVKK